MISVKAFRAKDMAFKLILYFISIFLFLFLMPTILRLIALNTGNFNIGMVEAHISSETVTKAEIFHWEVFQKELALERKSTKKIQIVQDTTPKTVELNWPEDEYPLSELPREREDEKKFLSNEEIESKNRPKQYAVKELSSGKIQVGKVFINNNSKLKLNLDELSQVSDFKIEDKTSILIFHTHTSEAYEEIGTATNYRTTDDEYNVVAVGNTLAENLKLKNFDVYHCITKHDTPSYNGAYKASLATVENLLKNKKYDIIIDLHRDAVSGNLHFRPTTQIENETAAKLMFVMGTNASGLSHDGWMNNLKLALLIQNTAEEMYPGLFRDLNLSKSRYNQHLSSGALLLEVGSTGNTLSDTKTAMKYLANVLAALKKN